MNERSWWGVASLLLAACSSSTSVAERPLPAKCDEANHQGPFDLGIANVSGSCGAVTPALASFDGVDGGLPDGGVAWGPTTCVLRSSAWTEANCRNLRTLDCITDAGPPTFTLEETYSIRQVGNDGGAILGDVSIVSKTNTGLECQAAFDVLLRRPIVDAGTDAN